MTTAAGPTWNVPMQERSKRRFAQILDAASVELGAVGYDRLAMEAVARRAGSSIGSVYRYFPDKQSLIAALLDRHNEQSMDAIDDLFESSDQSFEDMIVDLGDRYESQIVRSAGMRAIAAASLTDDQVLQMFRRSLAPIEERIDRTLADLVPALSGPDRRATSTIMMRLIEVLVTTAARSGGPSRGQVREHTRLIMRGYLRELEGRA